MSGGQVFGAARSGVRRRSTKTPSGMEPPIGGSRLALSVVHPGPRPTSPNLAHGTRTTFAGTNAFLGVLLFVNQVDC